MVNSLFGKNVNSDVTKTTLVHNLTDKCVINASLVIVPPLMIQASFLQTARFKMTAELIVSAN